MNIALADATIAVWIAKNTYTFWRPVTAIRAGSEPSWTPLLPTPAFQEYPSAHSGVSSAAATVLASIYGNDTTFTVTSNGPPGVQRDFSSFTAAVQQVQDARIYAGFHYRFSTADGATLGADVGHYVTGTLMQPPSQRQLIARSPRSPAGCHQARRWYLPWPVHGGVG